MSNRVSERTSNDELLLMRKYTERRFEYQHILDSFNWFTRTGLPALLRARKFQMHGERVAYMRLVRYEPLSFYVLGKRFPMYPEIALLQGATYSVDVVVKVVIENTRTGVITSEGSEFVLMSLPILVYSEHCYRAKELLTNLHPRDPGCYLIINGKRYVVLFYEKARLHQYVLNIDKEKTRHVLPFVYQLIDTPIGTSCTYIYMTPDSHGSFALGVKVSRYVPSKIRLQDAKESDEEKKKKVHVSEKLVNVLALAYTILVSDDATTTKQSVLTMFTDLLRDVLPAEQYYDCWVLLARTEQEYDEMSVAQIRLLIHQKLDVKEGEITANVIREHIRDSVFPDKPEASRKVEMLITLTARLLQCKCGFVAITNPHHWGTRALLGSGTIMYETLRGKLAMLHEKVTGHPGFQSLQDANKIYDIINTVDLSNKFLNDLRAIKPQGAARRKMVATKVHGDEKSSLMLAEILNTKDLRAMLSKHRNNVDANSPDIRHRAVQGSFFPMMDYLKATEGKQCGSTKFIAAHTLTTLATDSGVLQSQLLNYAPRRDGSMRVVVPPAARGGEYRIPVFVNGHITGYTNSLGYSNIVLMKRAGLIDRTCSVVYHESAQILEVMCDANRLAAPVVVVDAATKSPAMFRDPAWKSLSFEGLLRKGHVMFLDGNEIENIGVRIAETFTTFSNHRADTQFVASILREARVSGDAVTIANATLQLDLMEKYWPTYALLHPLLALSVTCAGVSLIDRLQACRVAYTEKMTNQKMGAFLDDANAHVDRLMPMFNTRSRVASRVPELMGLPEEPSGKTITIALMPLKSNQEDAFIMNSTTAQQGKFHYSSTIIITETLEANQEFRRMNTGTESPYYWRHIDEEGIPRAGVLLGPDDYVIGKCRVHDLEDGGQSRVDISRRLRSDERGYVREVVTHRAASSAGQSTGKKTVSIRLEKISAPEVADKFAAEGVQKHILAAKTPEVDMPWDQEQGAPDAIMNPMGVPTRMDIAGLLRTLLGMQTAMTGKVQDMQGYRTFNMPDIYRTLHQHGYNSKGTRRMTSGVTGYKVQAQILVGPARLSAFARLGERQFQCRGIGKRHAVTDQAVASKSTNGDKGQKWGHFESSHTATYGAPSVIFDRMNDCCDGITVVSCLQCNFYATWSPEESRFECKNCGASGDGQFGQFVMSRTFAYLTACLQSMGIRPRPILATATEYISRKDIMAEVSSAGLSMEHVEALLEQMTVLD